MPEAIEPYLNYVYIGIALVVGLFVLLLLANRLLRSKPTGGQPEDIPCLDIKTLGEAGPTDGQTPIEFYNVPMRLAAVVMAPAGRGGSMPPPSIWPKMLDATIPGMADVLKTHSPQLLLWPPQLSSSGFSHAFVKHVPLPGDHGKGTPWCTVAGRCESQFDPVLVGLVFRSDRANNLGQFEVERATKWLDVVRIRPN